MHANDGYTKVFHKVKSEGAFEKSKAKSKEPQWKQDRKPHHKINILDINYKTSISGFTCDKFKNEAVKDLKAQIKRLEEQLQEWEVK